MSTNTMIANGDAPKVYLAGPEVFLQNARDVVAAKVARCAAHGLMGLFPLDQSLDLTGLSPLDQARAIALANEALMRSADAIVANLTPFRGVSMDSGTAFEVGFMRALGRPVFGYSNCTADYHARTLAFLLAPRHADDGDTPGTMIEDFGLSENLMIDIAVRESGRSPVTADVTDCGIGGLEAFEACLTAIAPLLRKSPRSRT